jgi:hypothetical protein
MSSADSPAVELAPIREMLRVYCHALTERGVDLQDLKQLIDKNIGWSKNDVATSDGAAIFLPTIIERFAAQADNFDFLKVMLTQQGISSSAALSLNSIVPQRNSTICARGSRRRRSTTITITAMKVIMNLSA